MSADIAIAPRKRYATLPNCDRCGRFTNAPTVRSGCTVAADWIVCHEELLCQRCLDQLLTREEAA